MSMGKPKSEDRSRAFPASASVTRAGAGPNARLHLGNASQYGVVKEWTCEGLEKHVRIHLEQPHEKTNFTVLRLLFEGPTSTGLPPDVKVDEWRNSRVRRKTRPRDRGTLVIEIKSRYVRTLPHPFPVGRWRGICVVDRDLALYSLQLMTMEVVPTVEPEADKRLILPGDEEFRVPS